MHAALKEEEHLVHREQTDDDDETYCFTSIARTAEKSGLWQLKESQQFHKADEGHNDVKEKRAVEATKEVAAQKTTESYNEVQKVSEGENVSQKHQ